MDYFEIPSGDELKTKHKKYWTDLVVKKWSKLGSDLFKNKKYYDIYANNKSGKAECFAFLRKNVR